MQIRSDSQGTALSRQFFQVLHHRAVLHVQVTHFLQLPQLHGHVPCTHT